MFSARLYGARSHKNKPMTQFAAGALIGGIVMAIALTVAPNSLVNRAHDALHECERNLPRSQQCHLVAVPNEVKE